jgi:hypothetical protein
MEFFHVGALVYFLRKVIWFVPDFTVEKYRDRLKAFARADRSRRLVRRLLPSFPDRGRKR